MRTSALRAIVTLGALGTLGLAATGGFQESGDDDAAEAARLFDSSCSRCHVPPDPAFAVDRAWLEQVLSTA